MQNDVKPSGHNQNGDEVIEKPQQVTIVINGQEYQVRKGISLAAALLSSGFRRFQTVSHTAPRGVFCGMGICFGCLVTVNDLPFQRACLTQVKQKMRIDLR